MEYGVYKGGGFEFNSVTNISYSALSEELSYDMGSAIKTEDI